MCNECSATGRNLLVESLLFDLGGSRALEAQSL